MSTRMLSSFKEMGSAPCSYSAAETNWKEQALHFPQGEKVGVYGDTIFPIRINSGQIKLCLSNNSSPKLKRKMEVLD